MSSNFIAQINLEKLCEYNGWSTIGSAKTSFNQKKKKLRDIAEAGGAIPTPTKVKKATTTPKASKGRKTNAVSGDASKTVEKKPRERPKKTVEAPKNDNELSETAVESANDDMEGLPKDDSSDGQGEDS